MLFDIRDLKEERNSDSVFGLSKFRSFSNFIEFGIVRSISLSNESTPILSNIALWSSDDIELCLGENSSELYEIFAIIFYKKSIRKSIHKVEK